MPTRRPEIDKVATSGYFVLMRSVGLKVLKNKLSEYVRLAAAGETVLVTDRERVVAEIGPPRGRRNLPDDELMARGVRRKFGGRTRRGRRLQRRRLRGLSRLRWL